MAFSLPSTIAETLPPGAPLIRMRGITKTFQTTAGAFPVLKGIDVDVYPGEFVAVVGRSGSGKSTLVNMLTGIDHPTGGTVQVGQTVLNNMPESKMAVWRGKTLGIVFQFFQLLPMLTVVENVMLPMDFCNIYPPAERLERALGLLRRVGLEPLAHKLPGAISGGQQQSVAVARALANDPPILIADEPTGNLDSRTAEEVIALFEELVSQGKTILMVTHDRTLAQRTSRTLLISDGELVHEAIAGALPDLPHPTLLQLSKQARPVSLTPREPLALDSTANALVLTGRAPVEVWGGSAGMEEALARLDRPTLVDPRRYPHCTLRAADRQGAELLLLDRAVLEPLLQSTPGRPQNGARGQSQPITDSRRTGVLGWLRRRTP